MRCPVDVPPELFLLSYCCCHAATLPRRLLPARPPPCQLDLTTSLLDNGKSGFSTWYNPKTVILCLRARCLSMALILCERILMLCADHPATACLGRFSIRSSYFTFVHFFFLPSQKISMCSHLLILQQCSRQYVADLSPPLILTTFEISRALGAILNVLTSLTPQLL